MPIIPACFPRSPANLAAAIDSLKVETNPKYQPRPIGGITRTFCNQFVEDLCGLLGVMIPKGLLARQQIQWLRTISARNEGWFANVEKAANDFGAKGHPVIVGWTNPIPAQSSHIAMLRSARRIAQAGAANFSDGSVAKGFGSRPTAWWVHL